MPAKATKITSKIIINLPNTPGLLEIGEKIKTDWEDKLNANVTLAKYSSDEIKDKIIESRNFDSCWRPTFYGNNTRKPRSISRN